MGAVVNERSFCDCWRLQWHKNKLGFSSRLVRKRYGSNSKSTLISEREGERENIYEFKRKVCVCWQHPAWISDSPAWTTGAAISSQICSLLPLNCYKLKHNNGKLPLFYTSFSFLLCFPAVSYRFWFKKQKQKRAENLSIQTERVQPGCKRDDSIEGLQHSEPPGRLDLSCSSARVRSDIVCHACSSCWTRSSMESDEAFLVANGDTLLSEAPAGELSKYFNELKQTSKQVELLKKD